MFKFESGKYKRLECFVRAAKSGAKLILKGNGGILEEYEVNASGYSWIKADIQPGQKYELEQVGTNIGMAYLSEHPEIYEQGICYLIVNGVSEVLAGAELKSYYQAGIYREQFHFTPIQGWSNDPNGLCWFDGYYHFFYQAWPFEQEWDLIYWGHAASKDLVHWVHLPFILQPQEELFSKPRELRVGGAFSGSAVVCKGEARIFLTRHEGPLADWNVTKEYQTVIKSNDMLNFGDESIVIRDPPDGVGPDFRDPKVQRIESNWYMVIGSSRYEKPTILLYRSDDLEAWTFIGDMLTGQEQATVMECPDFYPLNGKFVMTAGLMKYVDDYGRIQMSRYYIGDFQQEKFSVNYTGWLDFGSNFYAAQSFEHEGERIVIGWISDYYNEHKILPGGVYGSYSLPRLVMLENDRLIMRPIKEIYHLLGEKLYEGRHHEVELACIADNTYHAEICLEDDGDFEMILGRNERKYISLRRENGDMEIVSPLTSERGIRFPAESKNVRHLEIFVDRRLIEIYLDHGREVGSKLFYSESQNGCFQLKAKENTVGKITIHTVNSIWNKDA